MQYEIISSNKGVSPKPESIVEVKYKAYLPNGKIVENTYDKPSYLSMINVIDGLNEGLMMMKTGSKYKFTIPSNLAYGDNGAGEIPGGATMIFEVELLKVLKPGELAGVAKELSEKDIQNFHGTKNNP